MKKERRITVYSYGKINLSLDVLGTTPDGYHEVEMVMQAIMLHDDVHITWLPYSASDSASEKGSDQAGSDDMERGAKGDISNDTNRSGNEIRLNTNVPYVPDDERNIAYKAAQLMFERFPENRGKVTIAIDKRIPVAAGLAGGSGNGAAVLMGLAKLWRLDLGLEELMELGAVLGSDVPFSVMSQAACNGAFGYKGSKMAATCALAKGRGTDLEPLQALKSTVLLVKPRLSVSTAEVYKGIDGCHITERPDNRALIRAIKEEDVQTMEKNMINVLEKYTLQRYDKVNQIKNCIKTKTQNNETVLMTGSGPTIFTLCRDRNSAKELAERLKEEGLRSIVTRTLI